MSDVPSDWPVIAAHYNRVRFGRNPITLDLKLSCPDCIHQPHDTICNGYQAPLCGQDNDVCNCSTLTPLDRPQRWKLANS